MKGHGGRWHRGRWRGMEEYEGALRKVKKKKRISRLCQHGLREHRASSRTSRTHRTTSRGGWKGERKDHTGSAGLGLTKKFSSY